LGKLVFIIYAISMLFYWDLSMKTRDAISRRWARAYLQRRLPLWCRQLFAVAHLSTGFRIEYSSQLIEPPPSPCLIISNHQSLIDIVAIGAALPELDLRFIAKRELRRGFPGASEALRLQQHAMVPRSGKVEVGLSEIRRIGRMAREKGVSPVVFPEGTRSRGGKVLPFRSGAIRVLMNEVRLPILVCAVHGGYRLRYLREIVTQFGQSVYRVRKLAQLPEPTDRHSLNERIRHAEQLIREQVERWREEESHA